MPDIYDGELVDVCDSLFDRLPALVRTTTAKPFVAISNGHGVWEMVISNTMSRGDHILVLGSGRFAENWGVMAEFSGVHVQLIPGRPGFPIDTDAVQTALRADRSITAVLMVQVDTATSILNDVPAVRASIDGADHPALFMVDCIASMGCDRFEMDEWGVDVTLAASQKGLMVPPGLGFAWASPKAMAAHQKAGLRTGYWDWTARDVKRPNYLRFCGTPPVSHLFGLHEALGMIEEEGLENVWVRHAVLADAARAAVAAWATDDGIGFFVVPPSARSNAVTTVTTGSINADELRAATGRAGVTVASGVDPLEGRAFRLAHMGYIDPATLLGTLGAVEAGMHAIDAPMGGSGVAAAAAVIAAAL